MNRVLSYLHCIIEQLHQQNLLPTTFTNGLENYYPLKHVVKSLMSNVADLVTKATCVFAART